MHNSTPNSDIQAFTQSMSDLASQQAVVVRLGTQALAGDELSGLMGAAAAALAETLGADSAEVLEYLPARDAFVSRAGIGTQPYGPAVAVLGGPRSQVRLALTSTGPVIVSDWTTASDFAEASLVSAQGLSSAITVRIPGPAAPYGVISVQSGEIGRFSNDDGAFLQGVANILAAAITRSEGEQKIRHQALHDLVTELPNRMLFEDRLTRALALVEAASL